MAKHPFCDDVAVSNARVPGAAAQGSYLPETVASQDELL